MTDLSRLLADLSAGLISRRQFLARATALGLAPGIAGTLSRGLPAVSAQEPTVGGVAETITFSAYNVDQAPLNIANGDMDLYLFGLKAAGARDLEGNTAVRLVEAPATLYSLLLNPAPAPQGQLNPFSIREVRRAMQHLVDRAFIANDIFQGRALELQFNVTPLDYDQLTISDILVAANLGYDAELARQQISDAMTAAGAALDGNGKWAVNGQAINLKMVTRVEDERRDVGDLVRAALEGVGFTVQPQYQQFGPATLAVYASDPAAFQWHLYTEGWGRGSAVRYDSGGINSYAAPWLGNMPGWLQVGFYQYEQPELDELGKRLYRGEFKSQQERDDLYRQMTQLAIDESVRVWLTAALQSFPVRAEVVDLTEDLVSGPKNIFALRGASVPGRTDLKVGHQWVWTERTTWNPVGGFGDVYSTDINRQIIDPTIITDPFTGLNRPFRLDYQVETAGPDATLDVPEDAVVWDPAGDVWAPVGPGKTAISKVTYNYAKYLQATWHHGPAITMADVVYPIAQGYELAYDEAKIQIETALGIASRPILETFVGYRLTGPDTLEVYVNYWHFEESQIAGYGVPGSVSTPWELLAAMDDVVFEKRRGAYTDTTAARFTVPWMSLVTESDARLVLRSVQELKRRRALPAGVFEIGAEPLVTEEQATERFDAAEAWFDQYNLLVIGNGPYMLTQYDPPGQFAELTAFRGEGYPFGPDDFKLGVPPRIVIEPITAAPVNLGDPVSVPVRVTGPGTVAVEWTLVDPATASIVGTGAATPAADGTMTVDIGPDITGTLFPGLYQLYILASSDEIAQVAEQRVDLSIGV